MFDPVKLGKYPHMLPSDVPLWEKFLDEHGREFKGFDYDVHVGGWVMEDDPKTGEAKKRYWELTAKRIDAVGYKEGEVWLFEVKPEAGVTAVGQLVTYRILYKEKFSSGGKVVCCLICSNILYDEGRVMAEMGFKVIVV